MHPVSASDHIDGLCQNSFRRLVEKHGGVEIAVLARVGYCGLIAEIELLAAGTETEVEFPWRTAKLQEADVLCHNHPSGDLEPSAEDLCLAEKLAKFGVGFAILDNDARNLVIVERWSDKPRLRREAAEKRQAEIHALIASWG